MTASNLIDIQDAISEWPTLEQSLACFICGFGVAQMTPTVRANVSALIQDQLAVQVGGSLLPWSRDALAFIFDQRRPGRSSVVANDLTMSAVDAAYVNSVYGHAFEYDDTHRATGSHPGCTVVPTALAVAEELGACVEDFLIAVVVGYEVYTRIGLIAAPDLVKRGYQAAAVLSSFGAAATVAKLRGYDAKTTLHTMAIALSHVSGATTEYTSTGGSIKRFHPANGVRGGIYSADLARRGITGPRAFLSGNKGFFKVTLQRELRPNPEQEFSLARTMEIGRAWIKPYCCCGPIHPYIDAIEPFASRLAEIEKVVVRIQTSSNFVVGTLNANNYTPENIEHVQFSLPIEVAFALLGYGNVYGVHRQYMDGQLDMELVRRTARLIDIQPEPELDAKYPGKFVGKLTVHFRDGSSEDRFVSDSFGTPENPLPAEGLERKFVDLTSPVLGDDRARELLGALRQLDGTRPATDLAALCRIA